MRGQVHEVRGVKYVGVQLRPSLMSEFNCDHRCGVCCHNNGLIPPVLNEAGVPPWLRLMVDQLRKRVADIAEDYPCVFLGDDNECLIYEDRPAVCREFKCDKLCE